MTNYLDFEKPLAEIEGKAEELRALARQNEEMDVEAEAAALDKKADELLRELSFTHVSKLRSNDRLLQRPPFTHIHIWIPQDFCWARRYRFPSTLVGLEGMDSPRPWSGSRVWIPLDLGWARRYGFT